MGEQIYQFTEEQLAAAFRKWDEDFLACPENFSDIDEASAVDQAKVLIRYLSQ